MLEVSLARKLIRQITEYTDYNVNIMDENGTIIASRDKERVGTFHEAAYRLLRGSRVMMTVTDGDDYTGVRRGINMVIEIDGRREGVVGVTGDPEEIRPVALMIKMALETMVKYEEEKLRSVRRQSRKERFADLLIRQQEADEGKICQLAEELGYREGVVRIPVLCRPETSDREIRLREALKSAPGHSGEDIVLRADGKNVLLFKAVETEPERAVQAYRENIEEYLEEVRGRMSRGKEGVCFYVGTLQDHFSRYEAAYRHCLWLARRAAGESGIVFFYDHVEEYIEDMVPQQELRSIFSVFEAALSGEMREDYTELVGSLMKSDFKMTDAAAGVYMHKNTFAYRYHRLKEYLNISGENPAGEKNLMAWLCVYLTRRGL